MDQQNLWNLAVENLRRNFLRKLSRRDGEIEISFAQPPHHFFVAFLQRQRVRNIKNEIRVLDRMRSDFVSTLGQKLPDSFFLLARVTGVRRRMTEVKLIRTT